MPPTPTDRRAAADGDGARPALRPAPGESYATTVRRLASAQKGRKGSPAYSLYVNRPLGRLFAAAAFHAGLSPNGVTAVSAACSAAGIALLALVAPSWPLGVAVSALLVVGYALDSADGQVARLRGGGSVTGEWLDHIVDAAKVVSLHLALAIGLHRFADVDQAWVLVPLGFAVVAVVSFFAQLLNEQLVRNRTGGRTGQTSGEASTLSALAKIPADYGTLCLSFVLLGSIDVFLVAYAVLAAASAGYLLLALPKWYRDMQALDARSPR